MQLIKELRNSRA